MDETIVALASGRPPAAISVIRISGVQAFAAARRLCGTLPPLRTAQVRPLRTTSGDLLDRALVLCFAGPASATGEDVVELHCHGGRAVVDAVEAALLAEPGLRSAKPGEFTRRALEHGRIDLAEVEGLADLLSANTEQQRRAALSMAEGSVGRLIDDWRAELVALMARVEAVIEFQEDDPSAIDDDDRAGAMIALCENMRDVIARPVVERLHEGVRIVLAGPPNSGKSSLLNALTDREAAIVSPVAGTTRDLIEVPVQHRGIAYIFIDTAGLAETSDPIEAIGVARAGRAMSGADLLLWTGDDPLPESDKDAFPLAAV